MSAPLQHMGTLSQSRCNKRVALAELERNSIKTQPGTEAGFLTIISNLKKEPPEPSLEKHRKKMKE